MPRELKSEDVIPEGAVIDALVLRAPHDAVCRRALEIIRAYRKENGAMQEIVDTTIDCSNRLSGIIEEKDEEIERLTKERNKAQAVCVQMGKLGQAEIAKARAEAIDEFAQRLKKFYAHLGGKTVGGSVEYHIDQVLKEMKGKLGAETCVCCGEIIPEGRQVCPDCEGKEKKTDESKYAESI